GYAVGLSGDGNTMLMGGPNDNANAGAIWFFTRNAGVWTQLGSKLVGAGAVGGAAQGEFAALSSDGKTAVEGGFGDNSLFGATWAFVSGPSSIVTIHDVPNDQGGKLSIRWAASPLDVAPGGVIDSYWIWRQAPIHMAAASASPASLAPDGSRRL